MTDYKEIARLKFLKHKEAEQKILDEENKKNDELIQKQTSEMSIISSYLILIDESMNEIVLDKSDDNVLYNLVQIKLFIENIKSYDMYDEDQKKVMEDKIMLLYQIIDEINVKRVASVDLIDNIKNISIVLKEIFDLVEIPISIIQMDTSNDEDYAKKIELESKKDMLESDAYLANLMASEMTTTVPTIPKVKPPEIYKSTDASFDLKKIWNEPSISNMINATGNIFGKMFYGKNKDQIDEHAKKTDSFWKEKHKDFKSDDTSDHEYEYEYDEDDIVDKKK